MNKDYCIIEYPCAKNVIVCGDIHGEFNAVIHKLCIQYKMTDTLLIIAGDCGFGFEKEGYYESIFKRNSERLTRSNNWVVMVRGNHDDPSYFNEKKIAHERFRTIPDYGLIQACGHNILCIGGAVSVDREQRKRHDARSHPSGVACYWPDETPVYNPTALDKIVQEFKIDTVVTHTAPSFCELLTKAGLEYWSDFDADLIEACKMERETLDAVYNHLRSRNHPLAHWFYGHFHQSWNSAIYGVLFSMLDIMEFKQLF